MPDDTRKPPTVPRVVASYQGTPCIKLRPAGAPQRPGEPCGQVHACCRGHVRNRDAANYGDPCGTPALLGLLTCRVHGGQLPEAKAMNQRARAQRAVGRVTGSSEAVEDPVRLLAELAGEMRGTQQGLRELVAEIQERGGDELSIEAGAAYDDDDGDVQRHPAVTGEGLVVRTPAGTYALHPLFQAAMDQDARLGNLLASMAKLGIEERMARLEEQQIDLALAAVRLMLERMGLDADDGLGLFLQAARDVDALGGTVRETIEAHVVRTLPDEVAAEPELPSSQPVWP